MEKGSPMKRVGLTPLGDKSDLEPIAMSPMRKTMVHACKGLVHRISLDPHVITEHGN